MKLTPRLTLTFTVYAAALLTGVGVLAFSSGRASLRSATFSDLESIAIEKEAALADWVNEKERDISLLAGDRGFMENAAALMRAVPGSAEAAAARAELIDRVRPRTSGGEFTALMFIEPESGRVVAATDASEEGLLKSDRPFFLEGKHGAVVQGPYRSPSMGVPAMTAAAPVLGPRGELLGVLAGRLDVAELAAIIDRRSGLHRTDDAFLINAERLFVSQPRFEDFPAVLQMGATTAAVEDCLAHHSGQAEESDYRGVASVVVYRWIPGRELCLVVQMDQAEAYDPARAFGLRVIGISALALLAAGGLAGLLARELTRPLRELQAAAERFAAGERVLLSLPMGRDEIGDLSREFQRMAVTISRQEDVLRDRAQRLESQVERGSEALRETEVRLRSTMDSMLEGAQIIGFDYRYLYVNDSVARQGKQPKAALLGRTMTEAYPGIDQAPFFATLRRCMEQRVPARLENEFVYPDGSKGWFDLSMQPVTEGVFILSQDITERRRSEESLRRHAEQMVALNRVARIVSGSLELDEVYDGFVAELRRLLPVDRTSIVTLDETRTRWKVLRDWTAGPDSMPPQVWWPVQGSVVEQIANTVQPILESPLDPEGRWQETSRWRSQGLQSRLLVPLVVHDRVIGMVTAASRQSDAYSTDDLRILESIAAHLAAAVDNARLYGEVRRHAAELERRVADRTADLEAANQELEAFSYSVSHDLRAPLRAADGFSRILQEDYAAGLDEKAHRYLDLVRDSTQRMGRLIDDLLAFSRLGRQEIVRRRVRPEVIARQALEDLDSERAGRAVEIQVDDMPEVTADPVLLRQVYVNLLSNALKFTRGRAPAVIQVGASPVDGGRAFFVRDNGTGFDMAYVDKLFGVFQRLHRQEEYEGTGVGLAIVRRVVHRHGGRAWAEGAVDRGATFYFTLPEENGS